MNTVTKAKRHPDVVQGSPTGQTVGRELWRPPSTTPATGRICTSFPVVCAYIVTCVCILVAVASCDSSKRHEDVGISDLRTSAVGPSQELTQPAQREPEDTPHFSASRNSILVTGAVNETVAFEFILSTGTQSVFGLELSIQDFVSEVGTIPASSVRMYRPWPITMTRYPNWYLRSHGLREQREIADILIPIHAPINGQPFDISAGEALSIWVEIGIPPDTLPGEYETSILTTNAEGHAARAPVQLTVLDIFLSDEDALPVLANVQLPPIIAATTDLDPDNIPRAIEDEEAIHAIHQTFAILREHGLSPYTDDVLPLFSQDQDGKVVLDWTAYDAFCSPLIGGVDPETDCPAHTWPIPANLRQPDPALFGGLGSTIYAAVLKDYLGEAIKHFEQEEWLDNAFVEFDFPKAENPQPEDLQIVRQLATITHMVHKAMPFATRLIPQSMTPFGWFEHSFEDLSSNIDIWAPPARYQHGPTLKRQQTMGKRIWLRPDRPPFSGSLGIEAPPVHARSLPWQAFLQDHDAVILDKVTAWPPDVATMPIADRKQRSDAWLVYPGEPFGLDEPVPSIRLKRLQLGLQDYRYLRMLDREGRSETARLLAGSLIRAWGTDACGDNYQDGLFDRRVDDPALWDQAKALMSRELADVLSEDPAQQARSGDAGVRQAAWVKFLAASRDLQMWNESARLRLTDRPGQTGFVTEFDMAIRSELRTPVQGDLSFGKLSPGMSSVSDLVRVGPMNEHDFVRRKLVLHLPQLPPCNLDGHFIQEIVLDAKTSGYVQTEAVVSVIRIPEEPTSITIDGDLGDWPPSQYNIAGDFRRINTTDKAVAFSPGSRSRAASQTAAFFTHADGLLFIGLHVAVPQDARAETTGRRYSNIVHYEDLMPLDDDLIEILIDPTNAGTRSDDLYHIVLKSTGNALFERGIRMNPPIGNWQAWPGPLPQFCVKETDGGWSAEIAIPLEAFGKHTANPIWGINIARLEPFRGEYSDWARAPRYCYDPRTLGNLVWPTARAPR